MENYKKAVIRELDTNLHLPEYLRVNGKNGKSNAVTISVKTGTKMRNVLSFGFKQLESPEIRHIIWLAESEAIGKAISCAEIMKRGQNPSVIDEVEQSGKNIAKKRSPNKPGESTKAHQQTPPILLYQTNVLGYRRSEEIWEPVIQGLDKLKVNKDIPILAIILSKDQPHPNDIPINGVTVTSIQTSENFESFWLARTTAALANSSGPALANSMSVDIKPSKQSGSFSARTPPLPHQSTS